MGLESPSLYYALPPRGVTVGTVRIGMDDKREHYTYLCDQNTDCYAVAYGTSEASVRRQLANHLCPAEPRRDRLASGRSAIEKLWDELDEVIEKIKFADENDDGSYAAAVPDLRGQARGLAFAIAVFTPQYYRDRDDVLRQANRRWKMGKNQIPWEPTPGYNIYPVAPSEYVRKEDVVQTSSKVVGSGNKLASKKAPAKASPSPASRNFTVAELNLIKETYARQNMTIDDMAKMWNVSVERIKTICETPQSQPVLGLPIAMF